jgi:NAD-dependent SIR2 family protein deacetylase
MGCKYVITMIYSHILVHDHSLAGLSSVLRGNSTTLHFSFSHVRCYVCSMQTAIDVSFSRAWIGSVQVCHSCSTKPA